MNPLGFISIRVSGKTGNIELTPDQVDIREIITLLQHAEDLLFPENKRNRPVISYTIQEGSVHHIFKTSLQYIIAFNALLGEVLREGSIDFLDPATASVFEQLQNEAIKKNYNFIISTSLENTNTLNITLQSRFFRSNLIWADAEFYFYGTITNAGGKDKANIHLLTDEFGTVLIQTPKEFLAKHDQNILYKKFGVRALGRQNVATGEIDLNSLKFIELIAYDSIYDAHYLNQLRQKATQTWLNNINPDEWLRELRSAYE